MRKKNIYQGINMKISDKQKVVSHQLNKTSSNMNYLALSNHQLKIQKQKLMHRLENVQPRTEQPCVVKDTNINHNIKSDQIIRMLEQIQKQAKSYDFNDICQKVILPLGKRVLKVEIQTRKYEFEQKKIKKQMIQESFFRHKKIKKYNYQQLINQKLYNNSYIAKPYSSGKGFIQTTSYYTKYGEGHVDRLQQCNFLQIIKFVNKIYLNNYSQYTISNRNSLQNGFGINFVLFLCLTLFIVGAMMLSNTTISNLQYILVGNLILLIIMLLTVGICAFKEKPNHNNQLQQTKCDIKAYFLKLNQENQVKALDFEWVCPDNFMYLEVHFKNQRIPILKN